MNPIDLDNYKKILTILLRARGNSYILYGASKTISLLIAMEFVKRVLRVSIENPGPDFMLIQAEGVNSISINKIRELKKFFSYKSISGNGKIVIIFEAELMSIEAQNALLKILEEPPSESFFLLITHNINILLDTIKSRAFKVFISSPRDRELKKILSNFRDKDISNLLSKIFLIDSIEALILELSDQEIMEYIKPLYGLTYDFSDSIVDILKLEYIKYFIEEEINFRKKGNTFYVYSVLHFIIDNILKLEPSKALISIFKVYNYLEKAFMDVAKDMKIKSEIIRRIFRERIDYYILLSLSKYLVDDGKIKLLDAIEVYFISKNIKFLPFLEWVFIEYLDK